MNKKVEITICLGSSCFSRGNRDLVSFVQDYIAEHKLHDSVNFKGGHCFGACNKGPVVIINGQQYYSLTRQKLGELLNDCFNINK
ncbi:MAG TPA: NAD(P)H-dependent oxidoreductase subunit E [Bacteroidales bacterium]|jgi:NADH:ubiquinone oxidoreductase subunit E|nr:NAD(P)H-dependent oxidoreductase subunit E [Bacteroidales bacterium]HRW21765.1 NAD(P)H-dependent oxidoreductase subunit E [Bacteroidales bacterium]HXK81341.1 NAD(P)H-dependent oxidoreductase subunit E [Bacteroidales bacterium]